VTGVAVRRGRLAPPVASGLLGGAVMKWRRWWLVLLVACGVATTLHAHLLNITRVLVTVTPGVEFTLQLDVDLSRLLGDYEAYGALLREPKAAQDARLEPMSRELLTEIGLQADGAPLEMTTASWSLPDVPPEKVGDQTVAAMTTFLYRKSLDAPVRELRLVPTMMARVEFPLAYTFSVPSTGLLLTRWLELPGVATRTLTMPQVEAVAASAPAEAAASGEASGAKVAEAPPAAGPKAEEFTDFELKVARVISTVLQFLWLGFLHILPMGTDHILFVLGLFFLSPQWRPLVSQTTVFTIAHTTTLGLSAYGIFSLPARVVEPLIALSIAYVAVENIFWPKLRPTRLVVVFMFGLLHGLGFASSLSEVPMPKDQFFTALLSFNFGVDFGQLTVIAIAFLAVGWFREKPWYRKAIVVPLCAAIATVGLYWTVLRAFF
jgi:hypothetical protein